MNPLFRALMALGLSYAVLAAVAYLATTSKTPVLSLHGGAFMIILAATAALVFVMMPRKRR